MGLVPLLKTKIRAFSFSLSHMKTQWEDLQTTKWAATRHWICQHLHLGLPRLEDGEKSMWCMPPRLMVFCYSSLYRLRHHSSLCDSFGSSFFYTLLYGTVIYFMIKLENFFFFLPKNSYLEPFFYPHGTGVHAGSLYGITILRTLCSVQGQVFWSSVIDSLGFPGDSAVKNLPASASMDWTHGSGRSPGEGNGNPIQYSCLENSMDTGTCQATVCCCCCVASVVSDSVRPHRR